MKLHPRLLGAGAALILTVALPAGNAAAKVPAGADGDAVVRWNQTLLKIIRTPGAQPATIHSTRSFAALHVAMYDAIEAIDGHRATYSVNRHLKRFSAARSRRAVGRDRPDPLPAALLDAQAPAQLSLRRRDPRYYCVS
jgi:hypothetical protein